MRWPVAALFAVFVCGCTSTEALSLFYRGAVGKVSAGWLVDGTKIGNDTPNVRFYRTAGRRYGTRALAGLVERSAMRLARQVPGARLQVGDASAKAGGRITGHRSHRTGLDVDIAFFMTKADGTTRLVDPLPTFSLMGVAEESSADLLFDDERNWAVVKSLLADNQVAVQWIFVSNGLKARLLRFALATENDMTLVARASRVLHQPRGALAHNDHFHVRIYCPKDNDGCQQLPPFKGR